MKRIILAFGIILSLGISGLAYGAMTGPGTYSYSTSTDVSINYNYSASNFNGNYYYTWGIDLTTDAINLNDVHITSASVVISNVYRTTSDADLWVQLLENEVNTGVNRLWDNDVSTNAFAGDGDQLAHYTESDIGYYSSSTKTIAFTQSQITDLNTYALANDSVVGLGFDPDCHYNYPINGLKLIITTASNGNQVPEPATMLLFGAGLAGIASMRLRRKKS